MKQKIHSENQVQKNQKRGTQFATNLHQDNNFNCSQKRIKKNTPLLEMDSPALIAPNKRAYLQILQCTKTTLFRNKKDHQLTKQPKTPKKIFP